MKPQRSNWTKQFTLYDIDGKSAGASILGTRVEQYSHCELFGIPPPNRAGRSL
jgi:hypothetical protein